MTTTDPPPIILWCGRFSKEDGYATVTRNHVRGLLERNARVAAVDTDTLRLVGPQPNAQLDVHERGERVTITPRDPDDRIVVVFHERPDRFDRVRVEGRARLIGHTVFETDGLPPFWLEPMVSLDEIWAASEFNRGAFERSGVPAFMIDKLPHSLETEVYRGDLGEMRYGEQDDVVFLTVCSSLLRRDLGLAFRCFLRAFSADSLVRYVVKLRDDLETLNTARAMLDQAALSVGGDAPLVARKVDLVAARFGQEEMIRLYRGCDVYVSAERANGWDLPTMEAMACGKLTIGYHTGGSTEFADESVAIRLPVAGGRVPIPEVEPHPFYTAQWWPAVDEDLLVQALRESMDPDVRAKLGRAGAEHIQQNYDIRPVADRICDLAAAYGAADYRSNSRAVVTLGHDPVWRSAEDERSEMLEILLIGSLLDAVTAPREVRRVLARYRDAKDLRGSLRTDEPGPVLNAVTDVATSRRRRTLARGKRVARAAAAVGLRMAKPSGLAHARRLSSAIRDIQTAQYEPARQWADADFEARRRVFGLFSTVPLSGPEQAELRSLRNQYRGKRCFVMGNGPSLNDTDMSKLGDEYTFGVNKIYMLYDRIEWRPTFYTLLDWRVGPEIAPHVDLLSESIKFFPNRFRGVLPVDDSTYWYTTRPVLDHIDDQFRADIVDGVPSKGTIVMTALQIAFFLGFRDLYLIGVDASYEIPSSVRQSGPDRFGTGIKLNLESTADDDPNHFDPRYFGKGARWHDPNVDEMVRQFRNVRKGIEMHGGRVRNATVGGRLDVFERVDFDSLF